MSTSPVESTASTRLGDLFLPTLTKLISVQPGERVLDLCARDGTAAIEAARRSGADGEQLVLDTDPIRLAAVLDAAGAEGHTSLRGEQRDAHTLPGPDSYWDVVICHLAFPQLSEPETALKETLRMLRPVGRLGVSTWGQRDRCPLITVFLEAIAPYSPAAAETDRRIFRYSDAGKLATTLADAGFEDATPERLTEWPSFRDVDGYWTTMVSDSRFAPLVAGLDPEQVAAAKAAIENKTRFYRRRDGLEIKVEGVVLAAVK
ncbi:MAG: class I SAM-dependent methyltransferase [Dehalococcoidia bacterium]